MQMETITNSQLKIQNSSFKIFEDGGNYINFYKMYHAYFNDIPNIITINDIDITAMRKWVEIEMKNDVIKEHYSQQYCPEKKKNLYHDHFFIFKSNIVLDLFRKSAFIVYSSNQEKQAQELQKNLLRFISKQKETTQISLIVNGQRGLSTTDLEIKRPKTNIKIHYNDDFEEIHKTVLKNIRKQKTKGLYLFHGLPGTGKSTYIKYLIHQQKKKVIFLSPNTAANLDNASFTEFLIENKNSVLIIEDAEELIISRDNNHNSKLSFLLNLTDGLLGESLGIQIIATFNTDLKNIDKALLRKGRLTAIYEFKKLESKKTNFLLERLGHNVEINEPMTITDIYNFNIETNYTPKLKKVIGFGG